MTMSSTQLIEFFFFTFKLTLILTLCEAVERENVGLNNDDDVTVIYGDEHGRHRRQCSDSDAAERHEVENLNFCWHQHDTCDHIHTNQAKFRLINNNEQTAWHCNCDQEFFDCLHRINSTLSNHIGELYFATHRRCYRNDYKIFDCIEYDVSAVSGSRRCVRYMLLLKPTITNQWFDLPFYSGKTMRSPLFVVKDGRW